VKLKPGKVIVAEHRSERNLLMFTAFLRLPDGKTETMTTEWHDPSPSVSRQKAFRSALDAAAHVSSRYARTTSEIDELPPGSSPYPAARS
jgi:hypothetical protein